MKNMKIEQINENTARVSKAFEKNARIFGTPEYKLWREYLKENPGSIMITKTIKKNPEKKSYKNHSFENMEAFIRVQENGTDLMKEFNRQKELAKVQNSPYRAVLAWFLKTFEGYDSYKEYFKNLEDKKAAAAAEKADQEVKDILNDAAAARARQEALKQTA